MKKVIIISAIVIVVGLVVYFLYRYKQRSARIAGVSEGLKKLFPLKEGDSNEAVVKLTDYLVQLGVYSLTIQESALMTQSNTLVYDKPKMEAVDRLKIGNSSSLSIEAYLEITERIAPKMVYETTKLGLKPYDSGYL